MAEIRSWRTSTYTKYESCVEVADADPSKIMVRDSKARDSSTLTFSPATWAGFVEFSKTFKD
ncbi:hypothetical protein GCM10010211_28980 [Streptomyces albospinus]|uniref:DUF397 domain-containing protein n=1 Tax=Streptomyces albospinus TaxID=285515 RepID=A0ABQ2V2U3_9ACTN|nr:DUF397 domain-containing protein [Streptomyces albospinus]GGU62158.1 hypothetical protein GCM10010211_28980 [Streptomyces albospinus]